jgi:hypothetical protein
MKRTRTKAVGLGLALLAGQLRAVGADDAPAGPPALLPQNVRTSPWTAAPAADTNLIWLPSRKAAPPGSPVADTPAPRPAPAIPTEGGPRTAAGTDSPGPLPTIPVIPETRAEPRTLPTIPVPAAEPSALPEIPVVLPESAASEPRTPVTPRTTPRADIPAPALTDWQPAVPPSRPQLPPAEWTAAADPQAPAPAPRPVDPLRPMPSPSPLPSLPTPRPVDGARTPGPAVPPPTDIWGAPGLRPAPGELPTAPPELMRQSPVVAPGKHGSFGSPPIRLSRDYPALADLCGGWLTEPDWGLGTDGGPPTDRYYLQAELLLWWMRTGRIPALATTTTATETNLAALSGFGFLGDPSTRSLVGPGSIGHQFRPGFRVRGGAWFDDCGTCGIDGSYFFLGRRTTDTLIDSNQLPIRVLTRPFFSPNLGREFGEQVAFPGAESGTLGISDRSSLWGADVNLRHALCRQCDFRSEVFAGYRFLHLDDRLQITENIVALADVVPMGSSMVVLPAGTRAVVEDRFDARNQFHGGQIGAAAERQWGRFSLAARGSVALGVSHQELDISGSQIVTLPGQPPMGLVGGLLAVGPNLGRFTQNRFAVVPEISLNLGYWLTPNVKVYTGYNFLYWSNVIRPGEQIDRVVDQSFIPNTVGITPAFSGQFRPQPLFQQSGFWAQGIQFGLEARW